MNLRRSLGAALSATVLLLVLSACRSAPQEIPEDLSRMEMFQEAQEAANNDRYDIALRYYREFIDRFGDDPGAVVEAEYEIAFIAYKQEEYGLALERFREILAQYEDEDLADQLPEWPRILSSRLVSIIQEEQQEEDLLDLGS